MDISALYDTIRESDISSVSVTHGALALTRPLRTSFGAFESREISIVRLESADGAFGYGEAAPLPDWGTETVAESRSALDEIAAAGPASGDDLLSRLEAPTARFAVESALLDLAARQRSIPLRKLISPSAREVVPVNATLGMDPPHDIRRTAVSLMREGFRCIKLKVGDENPKADIARIRAARASGATIRIDANAAWSVEQAIDFLTRIGGDVEIEYCEQPVAAEPSDLLGTVASSVRVPIAADESCHPWPRPLHVIETRSADVLILKPMVLGGLLRSLEVFESATRHEMSVVFTSSIDSAIGRAAVANMVAALPEPSHGYVPIHHGLATGSWFERDVAELPIERGQIILPEGPGIGVWPLLNALT